MQSHQNIHNFNNSQYLTLHYDNTAVKNSNETQIVLGHFVEEQAHLLFE